MQPSQTYILGKWVVEPSLNQVSWNRVVRHLEPRAMDVLVHLMDHSERVVSQEELLKRYWTAHTAEPRKISKRINQIRNALDDDARHPTYVQTIHKRGYRIVAPVSVLRASTSTEPTRKAPASTDTVHDGVNTRTKLAVLPFVNLSSEESHHAVSEGITAELIVSLSQLPQLQVPGRMAVLPYCDVRQPLSDVADALGVDLLVIGTVSVEEPLLRVSVELMSAQSDSPLWARCFEADSALSLRREIASVLASISWGATGEVVESERLNKPVNHASEAAYRDALACMGLQDYRKDWWSEAEACFRKVIDIKNDHAGAWSYLSLLHVMRCSREGDNDFELCEEMANKALAINSDLALPHVSLGYCALLGRWNIIAARHEFEQALARGSDDPTVLHGYQLLLRVEERDVESLEIARQLRRAAPNDIRYQSEAIKLYYQSRHYEKAITSAEGIRRSIAGHVDMSEAAALHAVGRFEDSYRARLATYKLLGAEGHARATILESGWKQGGYIGALKALSEYQLTHDSTTVGVVPSEFLFLPDRAERLIELLRRDIENRHPAMIGLLHHPDYDGLRVYSTMQDLLEEIVPGRQTNSPARQADVFRIRIFRGEAAAVVDSLGGIIKENSEDMRLPRWIESMAWASFSLGDFSNVITLTESLLERDISDHTKTQVLLLRSASLAESDSRPADARNAFLAANETWPGELEIDRDIAPLFFGGDRSLERRFIAALTRVSQFLVIS